MWRMRQTAYSLNNCADSDARSHAHTHARTTVGRRRARGRPPGRRRRRRQCPVWWAVTSARGLAQ